MALPKTGTSLPNYLQPSQGKNLYGGNYINFLDSDFEQWGQQFLPDVYDKEIEIYGNRTISGFLKMVSAEMPSSSDQIIWLEQGRLHTRYTDISLTHGATATTAGTGTTALTVASSLTTGRYITGTINYSAASASSVGENASPFDSQTNTAEGIYNAAGTAVNCNFKVGQTVMVGTASGVTLKGVITFVNNNVFIFQNYKGKAVPAGDFTTANTGAATALVYGSEFAKGSGNFTEKLDPSYSTYQNSPIIMKEHYAINGSDTGQIGWVEVTSENGASGYLWYVKAEHENRLRWEDYQEMAMVEGVQNDATSANAASLNAYRGDGGVTQQSLAARGTQGFFDALEERGNVFGDLSGELYDSSNAANNGINALGDTFDAILKQMDKQGAIQENMLYLNRDTALAFDNFMASQNNYGANTGVSWGVFNNSKDMALDLGFSGLRRGSYDFYKTDWKYLNDFSTRGGFADIEGVLIPAGTSTVYDQNLGKNIKRPFLHVRYRASETDNRKMKSWITGSVGGAYTTDVDEMRMHYLTERCLITQGANNFFLFQAGA